MIHPETQKVTLANGPRPAGRADECFYCHQPIGADHLYDCALRRRTVVVRLTIDCTRVVPAHWTPSDIEFHLNGSSWCMDNIIDVLERPGEHGCCLCDCTKGEYVCEATEDHDELFGYTDLLAADEEADDDTD